MAENRLNLCCHRALGKARLREFAVTQEDLAYLFGMSRRWIGELQRSGVLPVDAPLPELVKRMARHRVEAKIAQGQGRRRGAAS